MNHARVLFIAPHADDEVLGAGGTLLKWRQAGAVVQLVLVCCSEVKLNHFGHVSGKTRRHEFSASAAALSSGDPSVLDFRDQGLYGSEVSRLVRALDEQIDKFRPTVFIYPEPSYHQDHQQVNKACIASLRMTGKYAPDACLEYEIPTAMSPGSSFEPNFFVDINEHQQEKERIFTECYPSQKTQSKRGLLSIEGIRKYAFFRGVQSGLELAEAFRLVRIKA